MRFIFSLIFFLLSFSIHAQQKEIDSLKNDIRTLKIDSLKIKSYYRLASFYIKAEDSTNADNSYRFGIQIAKKQGKHFWVVYGLNELGYLLEITGNPSAALNIYQEAIIFGRKNAVLGERARAFSNLSFVYGSLFQADKSIEAIDSSLAIYRTLGFKKNIAGALNNLGAKYLDQFKFEKALSYFNEAIIICEEINDKKNLTLIYLNIGLINIETKKYDIGIEYLNKSKKLSELQNDINNVVLVNYNISKAYHDKKEYSVAISLLEEYLPKAEKIRPRKLYANYLNLLATCYRGIKNYDNARTFFLKSFTEMQLQDNFEGLAVNYSNYASMLAERGDYDSALVYANQANSIIKKYKELEKYQPQVFESIAQIYYKQKKYAEAFAYQDSQIVKKEELINGVSNLKLLELQTKYETSQKENKIKLLSREDSINNLKILNQQLVINQANFQLTQQKLALTGAQLRLAEDSLLLFSQNETILNNQLEAALKTDKINELTKTGLRKELVLQKQESAIKQKNATILIIVILALLLSLTGFAFYKKKQIEQKRVFETAQAKQREDLAKAVIEAEESERKRIAGDLHDGIGQLFSAVKMNLNGLLERVDLPKTEDKFLAEKTLALVEESCKEVRVLSHKMMPNFLLKSGIASDIRSFIEKIDEQKLKIHFESIGFKDQLEFNEEVILYRVIQELINNVIKHANANELGLILEKTSHQISVILTDNGVGFNYEEGKAKDGLGLKNILIRVAYLKGNIQFSPNMPSGTKVQITIPIT